MRIAPAKPAVAPKRVRRFDVHITLDRETYAQLEEMAADQHRPVANLASHLLIQCLMAGRPV